MVLFGGREGIDPSLNDTWTWDGKNWTQLHLSTSPPVATGAAAFDPESGTVVAVLATLADATKLQTWTWDGSVWHQRTSSSSPPYRLYFSAAQAMAGGSIAIFGGKPGGPKPLGDLWLWDNTNWQER